MIIGLTGGLGTGKTTVAKMFGRCGAYVIDADRIVHRILNKSVRKKLAGFIFDDKNALQKLCRIIHPIVKKEIYSEIRKNRTKRTIVLDAPLLIESGLDERCDLVVVVKTTLKKQLERASKNLRIPRSQARKRLRLQLPLKKKIAMADFIIDNGGSLRNTQKQVEKIWETLNRGER